MHTRRQFGSLLGILREFFINVRREQKKRKGKIYFASFLNIV